MAPGSGNGDDGTPAPSTVDRPYVSVVLLCFDRRDFVLEAARSVVGPSGLARDVELLVLKNFVDPEIDAELLRLGAKCPSVNGTYLGAWLADASPKVRGEVLAFLDDDDVFLAEKLSIVREEFRREPRLTYYHNAHTILGAAERTLGPVAPATRTAVVGTRIAVTPGDRTGSTLASLWRAGAAFNLSSIAVRRSVVEPCRSVLAEIQVSASACLYFLALGSPGALVADSRILTGYRVHAENASGTTSISLDERWSREIRRSPQTGHDCDVILEYLTNRDASRAIRRPVEVARSRIRLLASVGAAPVSRVRVVLRMVELLWISVPGYLRESRPYLRLGASALRSGRRPGPASG